MEQVKPASKEVVELCLDQLSQSEQLEYRTKEPITHGLLNLQSHSKHNNSSSIQDILIDKNTQHQNKIINSKNKYLLSLEQCSQNQQLSENTQEKVIHLDSKKSIQRSQQYDDDYPFGMSQLPSNNQKTKEYFQNDNQVIISSMKQLQTNYPTYNITNKTHQIDQYPLLDYPTADQQFFESMIAQKHSPVQKQSFSTQPPQQQLPQLQDTPHYKTKIINYTSQSFLTIQTQTYMVQVRRHRLKYIIRRRYSDFLQFHRCLSVCHIGCILYPFPPKDVTTFIQMKMQHMDRKGKFQAIQHRLRDLQQYLQHACNHQQIRDSQELALFLSSNTHQSLSKLKEKTQQHTILTTYTELKNILTQTYSYLKSFIMETANNQIKNKITQLKTIASKHNEEYHIVQTIVMEMMEKNQEKIHKLVQLRYVYLEKVGFELIKTDIDLLLQLCGKTSSSKEYSKDMEQFIDIELIEKYSVLQRQLENVLQLIKHRESLIKGLDSDQYEGIGAQIQQFDLNFRRDWPAFRDKHIEKQEQMHAMLIEKWKNYCMNMKKIWK